MKISKVLTILISLSFTFYTQAALNQLKPGLWENTFNIKSQNGTIEKGMAVLKSQMESMPAEQRKIMESAMAKQGLAVNLQATSVKVCISKERALNMEIPQGDNDNCTQQVVKRTANSMKVTFKCVGDNPTTGEGEFTFTSSDAYEGTSIMNTKIDNKQDRMEMSQKGRWLSSNCGEIKPY